MPKLSKTPHLFLKNNTWYFRWRVPQDVKRFFGKRSEIVKSLKTGDLLTAKTSRDKILAELKTETDAYRNPDETSKYRTLYMNSKSDEEEQYWFEMAEEHAIERHIKGGMKSISAAADSDTDLYDAMAKVEGGGRALDFLDVVTGQKTPTVHYVDEWYRQYEVAEKTKDEAKAVIVRFADDFEFTKDITLKAVTKWIEDKRSEGSAAATIRRSLTALGSYWKYLQRMEVVDAGYEPFKGHVLKTKTTSVEVDKWTDEEIVGLFKASKPHNNGQLANLILLAAYTGMRIEEMCAMRCDNVRADRFQVVEAKTQAGRREVPIHSTIEALVRGLKESSKDGYLLSGLGQGSYGDRSHYIGNVFGRLKKKLGHPARVKVFHSFRHSFSNALLRGQVHVVTIDFLMGHASGNLAIDRYASSSSDMDGIGYEVKKEAVEKVYYEGLAELVLEHSSD